MIREPSYWIRLVECGPDKVRVIRFLHDKLHFGLPEAARAVEDLPLYIKTEGDDPPDRGRAQGARGYGGVGF